MSDARVCLKCGRTESGWRYDRCPYCGEMAEERNTATPEVYALELADLRAKLEAAERRIAELEKEREWRDIESAPKDGTRVLLLSKAAMGMSPDGPIPCPPVAHTGWWNKDGDAWVDECGSFDGDAHHLENTGNWSSGSGWFQPNEVTHWMPLPEPPAQVVSQNSITDAASAAGSEVRE